MFEVSHKRVFLSSLRIGCSIAVLDEMIGHTNANAYIIYFYIYMSISQLNLKANYPIC